VAAPIVVTAYAGPLEEGIVRIYTKEVLTGLRHLHKMGIMHRDIKGQNVLVDQKGNTKLADFGASTQIHTVMDSVSRDGAVPCKICTAFLLLSALHCSLQASVAFL
jgi:serine/threonine protein kinase